MELITVKEKGTRSRNLVRDKEDSKYKLFDLAFKLMNKGKN